MAAITRALTAGIAVLLVVPALYSQEAPKPGKEHELLKRMEGTWDVIMEGGKGTMTYKIGLGGLWLLGELDGEFGGMKFSGKRMDTYDLTAKKYRTIWADSMSTAPMIMEGNFDKDNKVLTMTGEGPGQDGKPTKFRTTTEIKDADTMEFTLSHIDKDDKAQQMIKITYKRKK
jgi:hypothetical protein